MKYCRFPRCFFTGYPSKIRVFVYARYQSSYSDLSISCKIVTQVEQLLDGWKCLAGSNTLHIAFALCITLSEFFDEETDDPQRIHKVISLAKQLSARDLDGIIDLMERLCEG